MLKSQEENYIKIIKGNKYNVLENYNQIIIKIKILKTKIINLNDVF